MAIQFYTLEEAARLLNVTPDELRMMSRRGELRHFQDRGSLRFRVSDVDELARRRGQRSDPEVPLGEAPKLVDDDKVDLGEHRSADSPSSKSKKGKSSTRMTAPSGSDSDVRLVPDGSDINFKVASDSDVKIVDDAPPTSKPPSSKTSAGKTPPPSKKPSKNAPRQPDSGVRLIMESPSDSDVKIVPDVSDAGAVNLGQHKAKSASDSDIRLEKIPDPAPSGRKGKKEDHLTGEFDLDAEMEDSDEQKKIRGAKKSSRPALPTDSPFELAEDAPKNKSGAKPKKPAALLGSSDFDLTPGGGGQSPMELDGDAGLAPEDDKPVKKAEKKDGTPPRKTKLGQKSAEKDSSDEFVLNVEDSDLDRSKPSKKDSSDEFELALEGSSPSEGSGESSPVQEEPSSSQTEDSSSEFELSLDASPVEGDSAEASSSELELSLDGSGAADDSSSEFEISLDESGSPLAGQVGMDSSGEFELSLDDSGSSPAEEGTSEFELALDEGGSIPATEGPSDSEFDLTMETSPDELEEAMAGSGGLADLEDSTERPASKSEKNVFETDFDVPNIDEESDSQAVALDDGDTDLEETSDFGVALSDDDMTAAEDPSGSQVVALEEEEEADDEAATVDRRRRPAADVEDEEEDLNQFESSDLEEDEAVAEEDEEAEEEARPRRRKAEPAALAAAPPAKVRWGPLPAIFLLPSVVVLFFVGIMTWETLNLMWGNHQGQKVSGVVVPWLAYDVFKVDKPDGAK